VLAVAGDINESDLLLNYYRDGTAFPVHPPPNLFPQIPFATGSLGHGPGICAGLALGTKLKSSDNDTPEPVFCVLSDGELNEGSVWESFAFAAHHKLNNLIFFIDNNELQGFGKTSEVLNMDPIVDKLQAFGIQVRQSDGHDFSSLYLAYTEAIANPHSSVAIVAKTVKGRGLPEIEGTVDSHYLPMTDSMYQGALKFYEKELRGD
jgi:transketolase